MNKKEIIKKSYEVSKIINTSTNIKNKYFTIFYRKNNNDTRFLISIPKKTGKAVIRNKIKRQLKNIIDKNKKNIKKGYDYVIIVKGGIIDLTFLEKQQELNLLFNKIGEKK